ncbi:hypothetical protein O3P69_019822 [Scylla paramamosain]|uniref:Uncharacterized protein n=1 Tax=Scylla paramamosain TaxID=85552 RepID=A0AAW0S932_SCYPA
MGKVHEVAFVFPTLFRLISGADSSTPSQINTTPALQTHLFYILPPAPLRVETLDSSRGPHFCKFLATGYFHHSAFALPLSRARANLAGGEAAEGVMRVCWNVLGEPDGILSM